MKQEIAKTENLLPTELQGDWGMAVEQDDIILSRIAIAQAMSDVVKAEAARPGDIYDSSTKQVLAKRGEPLCFIPLSSTKKWRIETKVKHKYEFERYEDLTAKNAALPWEWEDKEGFHKRTKVMSYYVMLPTEIDSQLAGVSAALPHILSFQNTGYNAGQKLATEIAKALFVKRPPAGNIYTLTSTEMTNDKGTFYIPEIGIFSPTSVEYLTVAHQWHTILSANKAAIKEVGDE